MDYRKLLLDNWGIKMVSLGLSLTLWFYVTSKGKTEMTLTVPLEMRNIPQGMTVVGDVAGSLEVRVQGQERVLGDATIGKKIIGILDLSMTKIGENHVRISPDDIRCPAGVTVSYMSPTDIIVKLEPLIRKIIKLQPVLRGVPAPGYRLTGATVTPPKIMVEGPSGVISTLEGLQTMPIDIKGAQESAAVEPKIDYQGKSVKILDKTIIVQLHIERVNK